MTSPNLAVPSLGRYTKSLLFVGVTVLVAVQTLAIPGHHWNLANTITVVIAGAGAVLTYLVPNVSVGLQRYAKFFIAVVTAGGLALQTALADSIVSSQEWVTIAIACLAALGVFVAPNAHHSDNLR